MYLTYEDIDPVKFVLDTILKEAKHEDRLVLQVFVTGLSAYSNNPINLLVNAPSGSGKNYVINKVLSLFPQNEIVFLSGMSEKALFHRPGTLVRKDETGQYISIEEAIKKIDDDIEDKEHERSTTENREVKKGLKGLIDKLYDDKKELLKDSKKLIDLQNKILVFLDTPPERLLVGLFPLLSHDRYEVEYEFVDTHNGIKTKSNVLRGWPAVICAQALDLSNSKRFAELQRRFITSNPTMSTEKYDKATQLIALKNSVPDFVYQQKVVSNEDKDKASQIIAGLKQQIQDIFRNISPGATNVFIPYNNAILGLIPKAKAEDMTTANKIYDYLPFLPSIYIQKRPRFIYISRDKTGLPFIQTIPIATFEDLEKTISLMEYSEGVRQYILEWFNDVFFEAYKEKGGIPDKKTNSKKEELTEDRPAVTTKELIEKHKEVKKETITGKSILQNYLYPLLNQGYIDSQDSNIDRRLHIYYPITETKEYKKLFLSDQKNNNSQENSKIVVNITNYPSKAYIQEQIESIKNYSSDNGTELKIKNHKDEEITIEELVDQYFSNTEEYFVLDPTIVTKQITA